MTRERSGRARMSRLAALSSFALSALLVACASSETAAPVPPPCPGALILQGAERTSDYAGAEDSPSALRHLSVVTNLASACRFGDEGVDVDLVFDLIAERGPALQGDAVELTYFVATVGPAGEVLSKQLFDSEIAFEGGEEVAGVAEQLTLRLPPTAAERAEDYVVYLGFQLDHTELEQRLQPLLR